MRKIIGLFLLCGLTAFIAPAQGTVNVFATLPEWGALVREIGGERVTVFVATNGLQDPHRIQAKPSLIARARSADLLVANGAELEIGWLPLVIQSSGNPLIQIGQPGYFEATHYVQLMETPAIIDRALGDVHPLGNPHIATDPRNLLRVGDALAARLSEIDSKNADAYRAAYQQFADKLKDAIARWEKDALPLKGVPIVVQHKAFFYLENWLGLNEIAALEAIPGVEPSSARLLEVVARHAARPARMVIHPSYLHDAPSRFMSERAKIPIVTLPATLGGTPETEDIFSFYEDIIRRLLRGIRE